MNETFDFNGHDLPFTAGQSVGAALLAAGVQSWHTTRSEHRPRGIFCGIGVCFDCLVTVDDQPSRRACLVPAEAHLKVRSQQGTGRADLAV